MDNVGTLPGTVGALEADGHCLEAVGAVSMQNCVVDNGLRETLQNLINHEHLMGIVASPLVPMLKVNKSLGSPTSS